MYCWGNSTHQELYVEGDSNDLVIKPSACKWREAESVQAVWAGEFHVLYLTADGRLYSSGCNEAGQLGRATSGTHADLPGLVELGAGSRVVAAACGAQHCLALDEWGQPYAWGSDCLGQLGTGTAVDIQDRPKIVKTLATRNVVQIACGAYHSLALTNMGEIWSWGGNASGACGVGRASTREGPARVTSLAGVPIAHIAAGGLHSAAVSGSGAVFTWGRNSHGQLGLQDRDTRLYPSHVKTLRNAKVCYVSCGEEFTLFLTLEGGVFSCGSSEHGQTGHGSTNDELVAKRVLELMGTVVTQVACGRRHALFAAHHRLLACGYGARGQLGAPSVAYALTPAPVPLAPAPAPAPPHSQPSKKKPKVESSSKVSGRASVARSSLGPGGLWAGAGVFAGWDHSFVSRACGRPDQRRAPPHAQPLTLTADRLQQCARLNEHDPVPQELMAYLESVFGSLACMNGSFLLDGEEHFGCGLRRPGVDLAKAAHAFHLVATIENTTVKDLILSLVCEALIPALAPSPADAEALRAVLWLPLYHEVRNARRRTRLHLPLACALNALAPHAQRLAHHWWATMPTHHFEAMVDAFKGVVVAEMSLPLVTNTRRMSFTPCVVSALELLATLNRVNFSAGREPRVPADTFYIADLCAHIDIATDYINWLSDQDCRATHLCNYAFIFDVPCKARLLRVDQTLQMQVAATRAAQQGLARLLLQPGYELAHEQFLNLEVRRTHLVRDAVQQISAHDSSQLKKPLRVTFVGEEAEDAGGVRKEFFLLLLRDILDPVYGMFEESKDTRLLWFSAAPLEDDATYYLVGAIFGLAIYNSIIMHVPFPLVLYKKLLGEPPTLDDLHELQPTLARSLRDLLDYQGPDVEEVFALVFAVNTSVFDAVVTHPLKPGGADLPVTSDTRQEYVDLYVDFLLNKSIESRFSAFYQGFQKVCGGRIIKLFRPHELMSVVVGSEAYDWPAFEAAAEYKAPYHPNEQVIRWFWEVFHAMSEQDKKKFLLFLTGSDRVPVQGMQDLKIYIQAAGDERYFPVAHTCFNLLDLPRYRTKERLRYCLHQAIQQTQGFELV